MTASRFVSSVPSWSGPVMRMSLPPAWRYSSIVSRSASEMSLMGAFMSRQSASSGTPSLVSRERLSSSTFCLATALSKELESSLSPWPVRV